MKPGLYALKTIDDTARWKIGPLYMLYQIINGNIPVINVGNTGINHFAQVVWQHIGCHTYGYTAGAI